MHSRKSITIYILLSLAWLVFAGWQAAEHRRFRDVAYQGLLNRGREIIRTVGVVIRSQGRFGIVRQTRLEAALEELTHSTDLRAVMLLNAAGKVVASAGEPVNLRPDNLPTKVPGWDSENGLITIVDLVDLGSNAQHDSMVLPQAIVLGEEMASPRPSAQNRPPTRGTRDRQRLSSQTLQSIPSSTGIQNQQGRRRPRGNPADISRPFWMDEKRYKELLKKQGLHGFALQIPITEFKSQVRHDLWIRLTTVLIALLAAAGIGLTWRNSQRMNLLQIRLLRASEMNVHLQDLNIAAAGLAHETRNPLNIVRGLAQIISQSADAPAELRRKAGIITAEVDRVTGRLNEFISYSHSPEPRPAPVNLRGVIRDVQRALESDQAEKNILLDIKGPDIVIEADEPLLRQVLFNLLLNAYQAVNQGGRVQVRVFIDGKNRAAFEVLDDGPGVASELREDIYKPYFTTRSEGTGLGLAVVKQIIMAHHWEIQYVNGLKSDPPGENAGAGFCVSAVKRIT